MQKGTLQIHSENILPIIKKWLYSEKDVFVRELVSNACDALQKVKILRDRGEMEPSDEELRVDIQIDKENKTLRFIDDGIGMDAEEVEKYIAQIAFSAAEEFMEKYKTNDEKDQFIGHFGLGFYSAYMVAKKVEIQTRSWKTNAEPVFWSCDGSQEYEMSAGSREKRGTEITLFLEDGQEEYLEEYQLGQILEHYCKFLPFPVYLGTRRINEKEPLWIKPPSECTQHDYLEFFRHLYPFESDPLFWVHLNVDYPFHLKGILYFPKLRQDLDRTKHTVQLYCNRVFVSDNCRDLLPHYLTVLRGAIDSPDIPLNVSRSYLQMDRTVRQVSNHIAKKVSDSLSTLYRNERDRFISCWDDVSTIVKFGILEDEKFYDRVKEFLIWKDVDGNWTTVEEYLERNKEKVKDKIFYTKDEKHLPQFLEMYRQKNIEVLISQHFLDPYLMQFLERKISSLQFQRIDAGVEEHIIDKGRENTILDAAGKTAGGRIADFIRSKLASQQVEVEAQSLTSDHLPGFIMMKEQERRLRDYMRSLHPDDKTAGSMEKKTFVVNTNNPLIQAIHKMESKDPELAKDLVQEVYELTLLSQRELDPATLHEFVNRSNHVLEKLALHALHE